MQLPTGYAWLANNREDRVAEAAAREAGCTYERLAEAVYGRGGRDVFHPEQQPSAEEDG
jgi:hypothetical protein